VIHDEHSETVTKPNKSALVLFGVLGALLGATLLGLWFAFSHGKIPHISVHGWVAMGIGVVFSLVIGCGLMWLSFYSARQGFDDRADPGRLRSPKDI
jgi:protein-S-isoprenylcysteine O-methyltransferase Ste14